MCTIECWRTLRPAYSVWMTCNWLVFASTSFMLSVPRYTLIMFPIYIIFAKLADKQSSVGKLITVWSILFLALFASVFVKGSWAF